jgi:hypothetical protein
VFYPATLGTRQRIIAGVIGLGLGIGVPIVTSVVLVATTGDPALVIFPLPFLGAVWVIQGLAPSGFTLEDRALRIERRWLSRKLPYSAVRSVDRTARPIGGLLALGLNGLFGSHGLRWNPRTGLHYLAITNTTDLVYLSTTNGLVVISPSRPDEFVADLERRLARVGPDPSTNGTRIHPGAATRRQAEESS